MPFKTNFCTLCGSVPWIPTFGNFYRLSITLVNFPETLDTNDKETGKKRFNGLSLLASIFVTAF